MIIAIHLFADLGIIFYFFSRTLTAVTLLLIIKFFWYLHWICIDIQTIQYANFNLLALKPDF